MIKDNIDKMIMEAVKTKESVKASVYRLIKNEFLKYLTAKNAKPLDEAAEIGILQKMVKQREESIEAYKKAGREDLIVAEIAEMKVIQELLPEVPTREDVINYVEYWYSNGIDKKEMGKVIKELKEKFVGVDGKMIADIVKERLV
jgi:uncharacterized protein YqeY